MNITIQTRLCACGILLGCCLITAIFNSLITTTIANFISFFSATIVLLIELKRVHKGVYDENDTTNLSIAMLGFSLVAGASLVGGMLSSDIMDGFTMYVDIHGQQYKAIHRSLQHTGLSTTIVILSCLSWIVSMPAFLYCCGAARLKENRGANGDE